jgi:hypothetical protein
MGDPISPAHSQPLAVTPEFLRKVEEELSRRLARHVDLVLGNGIAAVKADSALPTGTSTVVISAGPLLRLRRPVEWAAAIEHKISRLHRRAQDIEHLFAQLQESPSPERTGTIVLEHAGDYDDEFFEALFQVIARNRASRHPGRARQFEALRDYLRIVRQRARKGETDQMWRELAHGAHQERQLASHR